MQKLGFIFVIVHKMSLRHTFASNSTVINSLASKFELRVQPLSAEIKMLPHVLNCTLNDFYVLMLPLAMGSDTVPWNLQRHLHASLWIVILCRLGVFTSAIEEKTVKHGESRMQRWRSPRVCVLMHAVVSLWVSGAAANHSERAVIIGLIFPSLSWSTEPGVESVSLLVKCR